jgi:hypothetical protein
MPQGLGYYNQRIAPMPRPKAWKHDGWQRGENIFALDNEIRDDEFYEGENVEIVGKASIQLPRRGRELFATLPQTTFNGWGVYKDPVTSTNLMLVMAGGRLYKITTTGIVTEIDPSKTWDSNAKMRGVLLRGWFYFGNGVDFMAKTDGNTVVKWNYVSATTANSATLTGSGNDTLRAYAVTVVTDVGETEISNEVTVWGPRKLDASNKITFNFNRKTDSAVKGYNIYRAENGGTLFLLDFVDQPTSGSTINYVDDGTVAASLIYEAPTFNTTGGVKGNIFAKYANTLFVAGNLQEPDTIFYGGTGGMWESFNPSDNGGWVKPGRGDGEKCTAMIGFEDFLVIFKENSVWKFTFGGDGGPQLIAVIPQYGTSSPDTVQRFEKDIVFFGSDGRFRIFGYEPNQLNVLRTTDFSNRIQPLLDTIDMSIPENIFGTVFEQKYIICDGQNAYAYDRRYVGFLGKWTNQDFGGFLVWDKGTGKQKLFAVQKNTGKIYQILVDNYFQDDNQPIPAFVRFKRIDGGEDTVLKYFYYTKFKFLNGKGRISITTYKDGENFVDTTNISFESGGGVGEFMFDEAMFDEQVVSTDTGDVINTVKKWLEFEAYSIFYKISVSGTNDNHVTIQTTNGMYEIEDVDYERDEFVINS